MTTPEIALAKVIADRGGVLFSGSHGSCQERCCILEAVALVRLGHATDTPSEVGMPDMRPLNDARWGSDELRTQHMVPVALALWDWSRWGLYRQKKFVSLLALRAIQQILPDILRGVDLNEHAAACEKAEDLNVATDAAAAAAAYAADVAYATDAAAASAAAASAADYADAAAYAASAADAYAYAADAYAYAADAAAYAADAYAADAADAADAVLIKSCALWVQCAQESA